MIKIKNALFRHKYFFVIFGGILLYEWAVAGLFSVWRTHTSFLQYYALDYGMGFASYILPSALYRAVFGDPDVKVLSTVFTVLMLLLFAVLALFLERLLQRAAPEDRRTAGVLIFLFLTGPFTFSPYVLTLGIPETLWLWITVCFFVCLSRKELFLLCVPLCAAVLLVNFAGILCYIPFFCLLLLYRLSAEPEKSGKILLTVTFIAAAALSVGLCAYLVVFGKRNMVYSMEEFNEILRSRGVTELYYIDSLLYERYEDPFSEEALAMMLRSPLYTPGDSLTAAQAFMNLLLIRGSTVLLHWKNTDLLHYAVPLLAALPVTGVLFRFCFAELTDRANTKLRRFVFFCWPVLFLLSLSVSVFMSFDLIKWITFLFLPLLAFFLYVFYREPKTTALRLQAAVASVSFAHILIYCAVYALCVYSMYD